MDFHHVHFYVDDAQTWSHWLSQTLAFLPIFTHQTPHNQEVWLQQGHIVFRLSSPINETSPVASYLRQHPPGVVDVAWKVQHIEASVAKALNQGAQLLQPIQTSFLGGQWQRWCQLSGWANLSHTLIEQLPGLQPSPCPNSPLLTQIDHIVLNVAQHDMALAMDWYESTLGFTPQQRFNISTPHSGLCSCVMRHPQGNALLPINEPSTQNSQIQEFLDHNRGPGIQHMALASDSVVDAIAILRPRGLQQLPVPNHYYQALNQRPAYAALAAAGTLDWQALQGAQLLVDWPATLPQAVLLQTFSKPIFGQPTFFFELIERRRYFDQGQVKTAQGFGEGNFQALFEAIEREQAQRKSQLASIDMTE
jgi:4-hydroxyphenylpyruvate dioxygenase